MSSNFNPNDYICVVGIDFGTTYSGCCYAFAKENNKDIEDIKRWPRQNTFYPKTPTSLLYDLGGTTTETWGQNAHNTFWFSRGYVNKRLISRFKLLLNQDKSVPELPPGLTVEGVIRDYLKGFHTHICTQIAMSFGNLYDVNKLRYCLTVPAGWSDQAKIIMRNAATQAGLINREDHPDRLMLISEPEAAALYCQRNCDEFDLKHGQQFLICDAGGGTVDLVVFEIDESSGRRRLKEITTAKGESCGSTFLDIRMQELLRRRIPRISPITLEEMTKAFIETHKPNFGDEDDEDNGIYFTIPGVLLRNGPEFLNSIGAEDGYLYFSYEELKREVFEPVIDRISDLITKQLEYKESKRPMNAMFMVGGFSQSRYLEKRLREKFAGKIELISVAPRGELAIARGAVLLGVEPDLISQRIAKRTYGIRTRAIFDDKIDREEHRSPERTYCDVRFMPIVTKNQKLDTEHYVSQEFQIRPAQPTQIAIYACDIDDYIPRWTASAKEVTKIGDFILRAPKVAQSHALDSIIKMKVDFYFGKTEIKVDTLVMGVTTTFTLNLEGEGQ